MAVATRSRPSASQPPATTRRRRRRFLTAAVAIIGVGALVATAIAVARSLSRPGPIDEACYVRVGTSSYRLGLDQTQNAATIAAVAKRERLPDHAVTIALATALQESRLRNLPYGDRDSLGLFQQRPSQGWGSTKQLLDPAYAANAFYRELRRVRNWDRLAVTVAAQRVQRSAEPDAYAQWESESRDLAVAFSTQAPQAISCRYVIDRRARPSPYGTALQHDLGANAVASDPSPATRALTAAWLVAHGHAFRIHTVAYDGVEWTATTGRWRPAAAGPRGDTGAAREGGIIVT